MSEALLPALTTEADDGAARALAPMLPVEGYVVVATRALEAAKHEADKALLLLQHCPRDGAMAFAVLSALRQRADEALNAYGTYYEVLTCRGQA